MLEHGLQKSFADDGQSMLDAIGWATIQSELDTEIERCFPSARFPELAARPALNMRRITGAIGKVTQSGVGEQRSAQSETSSDVANRDYVYSVRR
jgi:hypothetical protein